MDRKLFTFILLDSCGGGFPCFLLRTGYGAVILVKGMRAMDTKIIFVMCLVAQRGEDLRVQGVYLSVRPCFILLLIVVPSWDRFLTKWYVLFVSFSD